ncbi:PepSY domain-containing protein [Bdellovibrio sp. HCB274]|uniref:PepSY domain-containing protein n=1 Tax=Bdellovibrio sp. HCB274 TaxID=3394361 RepID=UPI0039B63A19
MKHIIPLLLSVLMFSSMSVHAAKTDDSKMRESLTKIVPAGNIVKQDGHEYKLTTAKNTLMEVEFNRDGTIDEASGDAAGAGDVLVPGEGRKTLEEVIKSLSVAGKKASGDWSFKKSYMHGWVYEVEGFEEGKKMEYLVSAKDGSLIKEKKD